MVETGVTTVVPSVDQPLKVYPSFSGLAGMSTAVPVKPVVVDIVVLPSLNVIVYVGSIPVVTSNMFATAACPHCWQSNLLSSVTGVPSDVV